MTLLDRPPAMSRDDAAPTAIIGAGAAAGAARVGITARWKIAVQPVVAPVAVYLCGQAMVLGILAWLCRVHGTSLVGRLTAWDGGHFLDIAAHGYVWSAQPGTSASPAFLPGYPTVIAVGSAITGIPPTVAGLAASWVCGLVFACAIPHLVRRVPGANATAEIVAVALVAISPMSIVLAMAYSEALFCALTSWALVFALRRCWWAAGLLGFAAGLVRISGLALAAAFAVTAAVSLRDRRPGLWPALRAARAPGLAALATAAGTAGWVVGSGVAMGSPLAWFRAQDTGWGSHWDFGVTTARFAYRMATTAPNVLELTTVAILIAAIVLVVKSIEQRQPVMMWVYGAIAVVEVVGSAGIMNSKARLLVPAFTILIPVATWLSRWRRINLVAALVGIGLAGGWFSAYGLTIWTYAI